jgi:hypothetical protein
MSSLKADFDEVIERMKHGRQLGHASFEEIYYLVFNPALILDVKRQTPAWISRLKNEGWDPETFSIAEHILSIHREHKLRKIWLTADAKEPGNVEKANQSLANALATGALQERLEAALKGLEAKPRGLLMVTDLEALHPYLRIGTIEGKLQGKFTVPTLFLYPGTRTGKTRLKFLGFYPEDGNYRSVHVGG